MRPPRSLKTWRAILAVAASSRESAARGQRRSSSAGRALLAAVGECEIGEPAFRGCRQDPAKRRARESELQPHAGTGRLVFAGCHGVELHEKIVEPAAAGQPGRPGGRQHGTTLVQLALGGRKGQGSQVARWREPGPAAELARKMEHRQARDTGELAEVRLPLVVAVDVGDDFLDAAVAGGFVHGVRVKPTDARGNPDLAGAARPWISRLCGACRAGPKSAASRFPRTESCEAARSWWRACLSPCSRSCPSCGPHRQS